MQVPTYTQPCEEDDGFFLNRAGSRTRLSGHTLPGLFPQSRRRESADFYLGFGWSLPAGLGRLHSLSHSLSFREASNGRAGFSRALVWL